MKNSIREYKVLNYNLGENILDRIDKNKERLLMAEKKFDTAILAIYPVCAGLDYLSTYFDHASIGSEINPFLHNLMMSYGKVEGLVITGLCEVGIIGAIYGYYKLTDIAIKKEIWKKHKGHNVELPIFRKIIPYVALSGFGIAHIFGACTHLTGTYL
jgi:hypothetical protein